jgi:signal transduction histidine kinase
MRSALVTAVFVMLGVFLIYLSIKRVTRPLVSLTEAAKHLGRGEAFERVPVHSKDEIGRLASTFNSMSEDLKRREEEKSLLEEKLRHSQKMEAIGTFARGIAHDFNNILTTVQGSLYILEKKLREETSLKSHTEQIRSSIDKARGLVQSLFTFSRSRKTTLLPVDLRVLIKRLKPHLSMVAGAKIGLTISLPESPLSIMADNMQIEQLLINLCENSRDAMPDGGLLVIAARSAPDGFLCSTVEQAHGACGYALVTVSDNGTGMDEETKDRMFEPFFTTKEVGKGTGLGLSIVYGIIEQHSGCIEVDTIKGEGTVFRIYLPMIENNKAERKASGRV